MTPTLRKLIAIVVSCIAVLAIGLAAGCGVGVIKVEKTCEGSLDKSYAVLTGLLTTLIGLAVKLEALDDPKAKTTSRTTRPKTTTKPRTVRPTED